jgi:hypothetical protein
VILYFALKPGGNSVFVLLPRASFPLMAYCQNQSGALILLKTLERQIARASVGNKQRMSAELDGTTNHWVTYLQRHRLLNQTNCLYHRQKNQSQSGSQSALEIGKRLFRITQPCQKPEMPMVIEQ